MVHLFFNPYVYSKPSNPYITSNLAAYWDVNLGSYSGPSTLTTGSSLKDVNNISNNLLIIGTTGTLNATYTSSPLKSININNSTTYFKSATSNYDISIYGATFELLLQAQNSTFPAYTRFFEWEQSKNTSSIQIMTDNYYRLFCGLFPPTELAGYSVFTTPWTVLQSRSSNWNHIALTMTPTGTSGTYNFIWYVNGTSYYSPQNPLAGVTGFNSSIARYFCLGDATNSNGIAMNFAFARFYTAPLSSSQITTNYSQYRTMYSLP
jgi:hypothetical protein